jgi:hypothetical protein
VHATLQEAINIDLDIRYGQRSHGNNNLTADNTPGLAIPAGKE